MGGRWVRKTEAMVVAVGLGAALLLLSERSEAFCRSRACDGGFDLSLIPCTIRHPVTDCRVSGAPLHWPHNCISFSIQKDGSKTDSIDFATATAVVEAAFEAWTEADCGDGERPSVSIVNHGEAECSRPEYKQTHPNANVVMFRDDSWPYEGASNALALTTISYNPNTGEIYDADIELNTYGSNFTLDDETPPIQADFQSIVTHEIGHFLGLDHSRVGKTTMREHYDGTIEFRSLDPDDIAGICAIYPPGHALSGKCEPRHGFSGKCGGPDVWPKEGCGMRSGSGGRRGTGNGAVAAALALVVVMGARRWKRG